MVKRRWVARRAVSHPSFGVVLQLVGGPGTGREVGLIKEPNVLLLLFILLPHCTESLQVSDTGLGWWQLWFSLSLARLVPATVESPMSTSSCHPAN